MKRCRKDNPIGPQGNTILFNTKRNFLMGYFSAAVKTNPSEMRSVLMKDTKNKDYSSPEGFKLLKGAPGDVCRVCAVLQYLEHRSCGDTQPLTLPEYGDRKTIIPLTVEKNSQNKTKRKKKWRDLNGNQNCNKNSFPHSMLKIQEIYNIKLQ